MIWNSDTVQRVTKGNLTDSWEATGVSIDTRTLCPGDLFVAIQAERDGHDFVNHAFKKGASAALVAKVPNGFEEGGPLLIVHDVLTSLWDIAHFRRAETQAKIIALTGSVGKTSTKNMLRHTLSKQGKTHAAVKSYNNHLGVPLTLARMPIDADYGVFEVGMNNPGEIAPLSQLIRPHVAIVTNVGPVHLENFNSVEEIAIEKSQIFSGLEPDGKAIINADLPTASILVQAAEAQKAEVITFGTQLQTDWNLKHTHQTPTSTQFEYVHKKRFGVVKLSATGEHFAWNALATLAAIHSVGADVALGGVDLGNWQPPVGRGVHITIHLDPWNPEQSFKLIDDSFNANPISLIAGLKVLALDTTASRRVAILSDMLELGPESNSIHAASAKDPVCQSISKFHCIGTGMKYFYDVLPLEKQGYWFATAEEMASQAHAVCKVGDTVLVKGSKGSKASVVAQKIKSMNLPSKLIS